MSMNGVTEAMNADLNRSAPMTRGSSAMNLSAGAARRALEP